MSVEAPSEEVLEEFMLMFEAMLASIEAAE
jgi:hypothetical protein